jgi:hypothetical protein
MVPSFNSVTVAPYKQFMVGGVFKEQTKLNNEIAIHLFHIILSYNATLKY